MPFLEKNVDNFGFIVGFLTHLYDASQAPADIGLGQIDVSDIYKLILSKALKAFRIDALAQPTSGSSLHNTFTRPGFGHGSYNTLTQAGSGYRCTLTSGAMVKLLEQCNRIRIDTSEVLEVLRRCASELQEEVVEFMYRDFFLPFISSLCFHLYLYRPATSTEQSFIVQLLELYIRRYVKTQPKEPTDWERTLTINCGCEDCHSLRRYVEDKQNQVGTFRLAEKRRKHLQNQLDYTFHSTTLTTGSPHNDGYRIDLKMWKDRATLAKSQLATLSKDSRVLGIIGDDFYAKLLQHECFKSSVVESNPVPPSPHLATRHGPNAPNIPKKRSFVDITNV
jgi:hypothetical protein